MDDQSFINDLFEDQNIISKIKNKLPYLFQLAEQENSRNGKLGMEIGSARERILIALLMFKYGKDAVDTDLPITFKEVDVIVSELPISIKTITASTLNGVKLIWTVDAKKAIEFANDYKPECGMLLTQINWGSTGYLYYFTTESQAVVLSRLGKEKYFKLPKAGTNPRGVEISKEALNLLVSKGDTGTIAIPFERRHVEYNQYDKWLELWES
jgi:hypothetical protein